MPDASRAARSGTRSPMRPSTRHQSRYPVLASPASTTPTKARSAMRRRGDGLPEHGGRRLPRACRDGALTIEGSATWRQELDPIERRLTGSRLGPFTPPAARPTDEVTRLPNETVGQNPALQDLGLFSHSGGDQCHEVVGPAVGLFRRDLDAAAYANEVGTVLARRSTTTGEAPRIGVKHRPWNVVRVKDQKTAIEIDLEGSRSHPRRSHFMARRSLGTSQRLPRHHLAAYGLPAVRTAKDGHTAILLPLPSPGCSPRGTDRSTVNHGRAAAVSGPQGRDRGRGRRTGDRDGGGTGGAGGIRRGRANRAGGRRGCRGRPRGPPVPAGEGPDPEAPRREDGPRARTPGPGAGFRPRTPTPQLTARRAPSRPRSARGGPPP